MLSELIKGAANELVDRFKTTRTFDTQNAIKQISYLFLMRRFEIAYQNVPTQYKWSVYKNNVFTTEGIKYINSEVLPFIRHFLIQKQKNIFQINEFSLDDFFSTNPNVLISLFDLIDYIYDKITEQSEIRDGQTKQVIEGELYEFVLIQTLGKDVYAKFDIQKHLSQFIMNLLDPDIDKTVGDPACGTGGILINAYQYLITKYSREVFLDENGLKVGLDGDKLTNDQKEALLNESLVGFTNDKSMAFISTMNLIMHGLNPRIINLDSLSSEFDEFISAKKFDYIICNPPFGLKIKKSIPIYNKYKTTAVELLFLIRIYESLKEGGRAAVIVPEGVLFNKTNAYIETRQFLMESCRVEGIISFPPSLFQPFTAVKTSLLIFTKTEPDRNNQSVWFYDMKTDGYSLDSKRQKLNEDPLPAIIKLWKNRGKQADNTDYLNCFWIPYQKIVQSDYDLSLGSYKNSFEAVSHENPDDLLEELFTLEIDINRNLNYLRESRLK